MAKSYKRNYNRTENSERPDPLEKAIENVSKGIEDILQSSKGMNLFVDAISKYSLYKYSLFNFLNAYFQFKGFYPEKDFEAPLSLTRAKELGLRIKQSEFGKRLWILRPSMGYFYTTEVDEKTGEEKKTKHSYIKGFAGTTIYEISQCEGEITEEIIHKIQGNTKVLNLEGMIEKASRLVDIEIVNLDPLTGGYIFHRENDKPMVRLNKLHGPEQQAVTLVHEMAHFFCGHLEDSNTTEKNKREMEAELVAHLACISIGIEDKNSIAYMATYNKSGYVPDVNMIARVLKEVSGLMVTEMISTDSEELESEVG